MSVNKFAAHYSKAKLQGERWKALGLNTKAVGKKSMQEKKLIKIKGAVYFLLFL